ncbi:exodeoxyribonuclease III [Gordonia sp. (in: high G+C Gram-positive bacteria)]|uniref:exodeoxyribonuclease III n=1 Tax=unclassified Gordonia (in: high G+C Gram-positive bacteria) TaxID=2657482 RepID=UPI00261D9090|nr:exodeoxyribonuclease III [Gordonia sp. (in: high G+C Gram-positive bacteria)]
MSTGSISVVSVNVNGIRAAVKTRNERNHGMLPWLTERDPDVVLLQEIRASEALTRKALAPALDAGWHLAMTESAVAGRSGVGVLSKTAPEAVRVGYGDDEFDTLGRYLEADFGTGDDALTVASVYVPSGAALTDEPKDVEKHEEKRRFLGSFGPYLDGLLASGRAAVVAGDWNIAPDERDIKNWKGNLKNAGFLPHEREWVAARLGAGWVDVAREHHGDVAGPYAWWSWRGKAFDNDAGWRIDYHLATPELAARTRRSWVDRAGAYDLRWSDHAPVTVEFSVSGV